MGTTHKKRLLLLCGASALALQVAAAPLGFDGDGRGPTIRAAHAQDEQSCFTAGTMVLMADGTERPIHSIRPGDLVAGRRGRVNRVRGCERTKLGRRRLYALNDGRPFVTAEHPFLTAEGWKALDPEATRRESPGLAVAALQLGDQLCRGAARAVGGGRRSTPAAPGLLFLQSTVALEALASTEAAPDTPLFNLLLDGDHSYVADGWIVHNKDGGETGGESGGSAAGGSDSDGSASDGSASDGSDAGTADNSGSEASDGGPAGDNDSSGGGDSSGGSDSSGDGGSSDGGSAGEGGSSGAGDGGSAADGGGSPGESDGSDAGDGAGGSAADAAAGAGSSGAGAAQGGVADAGATAPGGAPEGLSDATPSGPAAGGRATGVQAAPARSSAATAERLVDSVGIDDPADAGLDPTGPALNREQERQLIDRHWRVRD
jgi:hypothetical protein